MNTTPVNPQGSKSSKKSFATHAATAAAAAGLGVAATAMAAENGPAEDVVEEVNTDANEQPTQTANTHNDHPAQPAQPTNSTNNSTNTTSGASNASATDTPEPVTTPGNGGETVTEVVEENPQQPGQTPGNQTTQTTTETVNPDDVADAIISEEQIDPNDIDMADVVNFEDIGTLYTIDGESYTAAAFHDMDGNQLLMVDVDGDDVFDLITDMEGTPIIDPNGNLVAAGDLTVDDAEIGLTDSQTYLAANDGADDFGADSLMNDIIS